MLRTNLELLRKHALIKFNERLHISSAISKVKYDERQCTVDDGAMKLILGLAWGSETGIGNSDQLCWPYCLLIMKPVYRVLVAVGLYLDTAWRLAQPLRAPIQ
jgi:hypothetical protein